jgi:hypothetical protein
MSVMRRRRRGEVSGREEEGRQEEGLLARVWAHGLHLGAVLSRCWTRFFEG